MLRYLRQSAVRVGVIPTPVASSSCSLQSSQPYHTYAAAVTRLQRSRTPKPQQSFTSSLYPATAYHSTALLSSVWHTPSFPLQLQHHRSFSSRGDRNDDDDEEDEDAEDEDAEEELEEEVPIKRKRKPTAAVDDDSYVPSSAKPRRRSTPAASSSSSSTRRSKSIYTDSYQPPPDVEASLPDLYNSSLTLSCLTPLMFPLTIVSILPPCSITFKHASISFVLRVALINY